MSGPLVANFHGQRRSGSESGIVARTPLVRLRCRFPGTGGLAVVNSASWGGRLADIINASRPDLNASTAQGFAQISRYLLILVATLLVTMPITEHIWTWDHFLQGGQDFELGALLVLSILCLVLLLSRQCQQWIESSLSTWWVATLGFADRIAPRIGLDGEVDVFYPEAGPGSHVPAKDFPLQI